MMVLPLAAAASATVDDDEVDSDPAGCATNAATADDMRWPANEEADDDADTDADTEAVDAPDDDSDDGDELPTGNGRAGFRVVVIGGWVVVCGNVWRCGAWTEEEEEVEGIGGVAAGPNRRQCCRDAAMVVALAVPLVSWTTES